MSIVVLNGYRLEAGTDIFEFAAKFRKTLEPERLEEDMKLLIKRASDSILKSLLGQQDSSEQSKSFLDIAFDEYKTEQSIRDTRSYDDDPNRCNLLIYPMIRGQHMVRLLCENKGLVNSFEQLDGVQEYAVDTRTDGEPDPGYEEWKRRADDWSNISDNPLAVYLHDTPISTELSLAVMSAGFYSRHSDLWNEMVHQFGSWKVKNTLADTVLKNSGLSTDQMQDHLWTVISKASEIVVDSNAQCEADQALPELNMEILTAKSVEKDLKTIEAVDTITKELGLKLREWFDKAMETGEWYD